MSITRDVATFFGPVVQARGLAYARAGRVRIGEGGPARVVASVRGSRSIVPGRGSVPGIQFHYYNVRLEREGNRLRAACDCPYFDAQAWCKHIWAVLCVAEPDGYLAGDGDAGPIRQMIRLPSVAPVPAAPAADAKPVARPPRTLEAWRRRLGAYQQRARESQPREVPPWPAGREVIYVIDAGETVRHQDLVLRVGVRDPDHDPGAPPRPATIRRYEIVALPEPADREILGLLSGVEDHDEPIWSPHVAVSPLYEEIPDRFRLRPPFSGMMLPLIARTGRCFLEAPHLPDLVPLTWDDGPPWQLWLEVRRPEGERHYELTGSLRRGGERLDPTTLVMVTGVEGFLIRDGVISRLETTEARAWVNLLLERPPIQVPEESRDEFVAELVQSHALPRLELPEELRFEEISPSARPGLRIKSIREYAAARERFEGEISFDYDGTPVMAEDPRRGIYDPAARRLVRRDSAAEAAARAQVLEAGFKLKPAGYYDSRPRLEIAAGRLLKTVRRLLEWGWRVEAEGKLYRRPGEMKFEVSSGIDWFELEGSVDFDGARVPFPQLLKAIRRGEPVILLGDGSLGLIPDDLRKKYALLAGIGREKEGRLRFSRTQVAVLDALLAAEPGVQVDAVFERAREQLREFEEVAPAEPGRGFRGKLRHYQKEGLGWMFFLRDFGFGGCLADDMGLGKTVMVLALLESRAALRKSSPDMPPSLIVVPRSLVFNWIREAARFTPGLRLLDHTGPARSKTGAEFAGHDVVITTYGTLRRDALLLSRLRFDYAVLDEAQAIKNAATESARAARVLVADHRVAMSGTPVENHLGELWSLFEFLNPGMLGKSTMLKLAGPGAGPVGGATPRHPAPETLEFLARGLRPFILRRTKEQVARELPPKLEQTIFCELKSVQRKLYDELKAHYRASLLGLVDQNGMAASKMQVLEALLRLRQAACHPGLIDKARSDESSAKLELLIPQIEQVLDEGHKALVFSQFTSFLAIVRQRLDERRLSYEYLDGRTTNREERVNRFQTDPACRLFLISLKAGGLGLNLTAAEYVYLLDPWWNPAVEAQAIDRTHRIGQDRHVFACRIIARDTVEEKVLELQNKKRALANALIGEAGGILRKMTREDLELLLS